MVIGSVRSHGDHLVVVATIPPEDAKRLKLHDGQTVLLDVSAVERELSAAALLDRKSDLHPVVRATAGLLRRQAADHSSLDQLLATAREERAEQRLHED